MAKTKQEAGEQTALLDKPRVLFSEPGGGAQVLFYGVLLALGCTGALGCFFGAFQVPVAPLPALGVGAVCLAFSLFLFLTRKPSWVASLVGIALWVGAVWYFFEDLVQGCAHTVNLVLEAYGNRLGVLMPQMATDPALTQGQIQQQCTVFCCLLTFPYLFFLGWALAGHKSAFGAFCLTGLPLCVPMLISLVPPAPYVAALLLFWAVLLLFSPSFGKRHRLLEDHGRYHAAGNNLARPSMLGLFLAGVALCMGLTYCLVPYSTYQRPQVAVDLWNGLSRGFGIQSSLRGGVGSGNSRVNLNSLGARSYTGETVLRVQYQWQEPEALGAELPTNREKDYLKSFVGSVYTGESWERLSDADQRELSNLLQGQRPQTLPDQFSQLFTPLNSYRYQVSVENVSANPRCVYTPYGLVESTVDTAQMEFVDDGFLQSSHFFGGTPTYTLEGWGLSNSLAYYPSQVQSAILEGYANSQGYSSSDIDYWSQVPGMADIMDALTGELFSQNGEFLVENQDLWKIPADLVQYLSPQQQELALTVEAYNDFVYEHYTQLPPELEATLQTYLTENHLNSGVFYGPYSDPYARNHYTQTPLLIQQIANTLAAQCVYTLTPPALPAGEDFVEFFLLESRQGYCVHFATAATALLRAMGIPARYAEGYAVPAGEEGWVDVPDYNAHAWVEVYFGGAGWIPFEVTPAGPDSPAATFNARPQEQGAAPTATPAPTPSPTPQPVPTPEAQAPTAPSAAPQASASPLPGEAGAEGERAGPWGWIAAGATALGLLLLAGAVLLRHKLVLKFRQERFRQPNRNKAALEAYAFLQRVHKTAKTALHGWDDTIPPQLEELALKARFSQHTLTQEELEPFLEELDKALSLLRERLPKGRRLWCRYGLCLF